jgi:hypothetical protein
MKRQVEEHLYKLTPEECRCADIVDQIWPEGKPEPKLVGAESAVKEIARVIDTLVQQPENNSTEAENYSTHFKQARLSAGRSAAEQ